MQSASADEILEILDQGARDFIFPMLDNGYVYLAATRLHLYRSDADWALQIEVFGYSPRAGEPDLNVTTFSSNPLRSKTEADFASGEAFLKYLENNRHTEQSFFYPIDETDWIGFEHGEAVRADAETLSLRGKRVPLPTPEIYSAAGVVLEEPPTRLVFELTRALAYQHRAEVLASEAELRANLQPGLERLLTLNEWHHPDVCDSEALPSRTETFRQFAAVLATGELSKYETAEVPNTHWSNWPFGGTL